MAVRLWDDCDAALTSRLGDVEVRAALAAAGRNAGLSARRQWSFGEAWGEYWAAMRPVELTAAVGQRAGDLAAIHGLRGADAVHLASALEMRDESLVLAVWDRRLHKAAMSAGLAVAPAVL